MRTHDKDIDKTKRTNSSDESGTATMMPPALQLKAAGAASETATDNDNEVSVPEKLGDTQTGPIAVRGEDDEHEMSPTDVNQGSIGDCYFLAALMAIAHAQPDLLKNNISENSDGTYNVRIYQKQVEDGWFGSSVSFSSTIYKIYPTFPKAAAGTDTANPDAAAKPPHAHGGDTNKDGETELWVRLFEKAYAMMRGSYAEISSGGSRVDALEALTGEEYEWHASKGNAGWFESDAEHIAEHVIDMMGDDIPVTAGTGGLDLSSLSDEMQTYAAENDIVVPHAYAVVAADANSVTVRNPWGGDADNPEPTMSWEYFIEFFPFITQRG